jgi:hypothetical protein
MRAELRTYYSELTAGALSLYKCSSPSEWRSGGFDERTVDSGNPEDERFEATMTVLEELMEHHVEKEEHEMFKAAEKRGDGLGVLGARMEAGNGPQRGGDKGVSLPPQQSAQAHSGRQI